MDKSGEVILRLRLELANMAKERDSAVLRLGHLKDAAKIPDGEWKIMAARLFAAVRNLRMVHAMGCDLLTCETCKHAYDADRSYQELWKREECPFAEEKTT